MTTSTPVVRRPVSTAESTRAYLELSRLLDDVERRNPEISGPLRLTLVRAHRDHETGWLDAVRFREVVADLLDHTTGPSVVPTHLVRRSGRSDERRS